MDKRKRHEFSKLPEQFQVMKTPTKFAKKKKQEVETNEDLLSVSPEHQEECDKNLPFPKFVKKIKREVETNEDLLSLSPEHQKEFEFATQELKKKVQKKDVNPGVIYLGHIPHGFFENEMQKFFSQFGKVTRLRLARSKKTGKSRGYAFIEFECAQVAQIVAETMNNYLMFDKILKCCIIPPEKVYPFLFKGWKIGKLLHSDINRFRQNAVRSDERKRLNLKNKLRRIRSINKKLLTKGINFDFEIEIPEELKLKEIKTEPKTSKITPKLSTRREKSKGFSRQSMDEKEGVLHVISQSIKQETPKEYRKSGKVEFIELIDPSSIKKEKSISLSDTRMRKKGSQIQKSRNSITKYLSQSNTESPVHLVEVDSSDDEIDFITPPNSVKVSKKDKKPKLFKRKSKSPRAA